MQSHLSLSSLRASAQIAGILRFVLLSLGLVAAGCELDRSTEVDADLPVFAASADAAGLPATADAESFGPAFDAPSRPDSEPRAGSHDAGAAAQGDAATVDVREASVPSRPDAVREDAGGALPPLDLDGEPLDEVTDAWTYVEFPDTQCRDGSPAAIMVKRGTDARKLVIYLEGGGQCTDVETCAQNPFFAATFALTMGIFTATGGIFNFDNPENPVGAWNFVYVPYCTGDRHWGANPDADVPDVGPQKFVGYSNLKSFLNRIVPTFRDATDVLLTGLSAGGFGALGASTLVQRAFPDVKVRTVSDSGPLVTAPVYAPCWQERHRTLWKLDETILADCGQACTGKREFAGDYAAFLARTFADRPTGLIVSAGDFFGRSFFSIGQDECTHKLDLFFLTEPAISYEAYRENLMSYRELLRPFANAGTFILDNEEHGWIHTDDFYTVSVAGVRLVDWFGKIARGEPAGHAGP